MPWEGKPEAYQRTIWRKDGRVGIAAIYKLTFFSQKRNMIRQPAKRYSNEPLFKKDRQSRKSGKDTWGITSVYLCSPVSCTTCACYYKSSLWIINHNREEPFHIVLFLYVRNVLVLWIYQCNVSGVAEHKWIDTWSSIPYFVPFRVFLVKLTDWRANEALEERRLSDWLILWLMVPMDNTT